jgi:hypothetical protein
MLCALRLCDYLPRLHERSAIRHGIIVNNLLNSTCGYSNFIAVNLFMCILLRSCWLDLADLCMTEHIPPPTWTELDPAAQQQQQSFDTRSRSGNSNGNVSGETAVGQEARVMYLCFLTHMYLEQQHGDKALQVLEGVAYVFPNSQIVATQVR